MPVTDVVCTRDRGRRLAGGGGRLAGGGGGRIRGGGDWVTLVTLVMCKKKNWSFKT